MEWVIGRVSDSGSGYPGSVPVPSNSVPVPVPRKANFWFSVTVRFSVLKRY